MRFSFHYNSQWTFNDTSLNYLMCISWNDYHNKHVHHLTLKQNFKKRKKVLFLVWGLKISSTTFIRKTVLVIFIILYIISLLLIYHINRRLYFLTTFMQFPSPTPSLRWPQIWFLFVWVCLLAFELSLNYNTMLVPG